MTYLQTSLEDLKIREALAQLAGLTLRRHYLTRLGAQHPRHFHLALRMALVGELPC